MSEEIEERPQVKITSNMLFLLEKEMQELYDLIPEDNDNQIMLKYKTRQRISMLKSVLGDYDKVLEAVRSNKRRLVLLNNIKNTNLMEDEKNRELAQEGEGGYDD